MIMTEPEEKWLICMYPGVSTNNPDSIPATCHKCSCAVVMDPGNLTKIEQEGWKLLCLMCALPVIMHPDSECQGGMIGGHIYRDLGDAVAAAARSQELARERDKRKA